MGLFARGKPLTGKQGAWQPDGHGVITRETRVRRCVDSRRRPRRPVAKTPRLQ